MERFTQCQWRFLDICKTSTVTSKFEVYIVYLSCKLVNYNHDVENNERQMQEEVNDCATICCGQVDYNPNKLNISVFAC